MCVSCSLVWSELRVNWIVILTWASIQTCLNFRKPPGKGDRQCQSKIKPKLLSLFAQQAQISTFADLPETWTIQMPLFPLSMLRQVLVRVGNLKNRKFA